MIKSLPLAISTLLAASSSFAATLGWDITPANGVINGGAGTWNTTSSTWSTDNGSTNFAWSNVANATDIASFQGTAGTVTLNNAAVAINAGGITFGPNATYTLAGQTATDGVNFGAALGSINSTALTTSQSATISANLFGSAGLTIAANGTATPGVPVGRLNLAGANTALTGGITITSGLVSFGSSSSAGSAATTAGSGNTLTLGGGGGIFGSANLTLGNNIVLNAVGGGSIRTLTGTTLTLNGVVSGSGILNKTDAGTLLLANNLNTFTGGLTVQGGWLQLGNSLETFTFAYSGNALSLASGTTLAMPGNTGGTASQTYTFANLAAPISVSAGTLAFTTNFATTKNFNGALNFSGNSFISYSANNYNHTLNLNRAITGSGTLRFNRSGGTSFNVVFASGQTNNYTGLISLDNSVSSINLNSPLGAADWTLGAWAVRLSGTTHTFKSLNSVAGSLGSISGTTVLDVGSGDTVSSYSGTLINGSGTLALLKKGVETLTLSGANTYTGGSTVNAGTLITAHASALGTGPVSISGGALQVGATGVTGITTLTINSGTLNSATASGAITATGAFSFSGGTWSVRSAANGITAGSFSITGGTIDLTSLALINKQSSGFSLISSLGTASGVSFLGGVSGYSYSLDTNGDLLVVVPEPSTYGLLGAGALAVGAFVRRRRKESFESTVSRT